eukprot:2312630-Pyramimonas_sp.AAC.4
MADRCHGASLRDDAGIPSIGRGCARCPRQSGCRGHGGRATWTLEGRLEGLRDAHKVAHAAMRRPGDIPASFQAPDWVLSLRHLDALRVRD